MRQYSTPDHTTKADIRLLAESGLAKLSERDREILRMRFFEELSQSEIADRLGVSQSYLSRLLRGALQELRHHVEP